MVTYLNFKIVCWIFETMLNIWKKTPRDNWNTTLLLTYLPMPHLCSITSIKSIQTSTEWVSQMKTRQHAAFLHYGHEKWPRLCLHYTTPTTILTGSVACSIALPYRRQTETSFRSKVQSLRLSLGSKARSVNHTLRMLNRINLTKLFYDRLHRSVRDGLWLRWESLSERAWRMGLWLWSHYHFGVFGV